MTHCGLRLVTVFLCMCLISIGMCRIRFISDLDLQCCIPDTAVLSDGAGSPRFLRWLSCDIRQCIDYVLFNTFSRASKVATLNISLPSASITSPLFPAVKLLSSKNSLEAM